MEILIALIALLVVIVLAVGILSSMWCSAGGTEWNEGVWFFSVVVVAVISLVIWLIIERLFDKNKRK